MTKYSTTFTFNNALANELVISIWKVHGAIQVLDIANHMDETKYRCWVRERRNKLLKDLELYINFVNEVLDGLEEDMVVSDNEEQE